MTNEVNMSGRRLLPFFLVLGLLLLLSVAFYVQKRILPQQILAVQMDLNVSVRYAFISDKHQAKLAVLDVYEQKVVNSLDTVVPTHLIVLRLK